MKSLKALVADYQKRIPFLSAVGEGTSGTLAEVSRSVTAPVLFSYVWWVLLDAQHRGINRLYFLARDGVILCKIAKLFCERFGLEIDCRCLYCSRASLRLPTYHFIGEEAYDLLFLGGYNVTPYTLLQRIGFTERERAELYAACSLKDLPEHSKLSNRQIAQVRSELQHNEYYNRRAQELSVETYPSTIAYLRQEGLMSGEAFAIVDSGWTGSMQRSLRQLLEHEHCTPAITGYYFGMYNPPQEERDGRYLTWYFDSGSHRRRKTLFCNNLFECMLSEPCGMTVGYRQKDGAFAPVLGQASDGCMAAAISLQQQEILSFTQGALERIDFNHMDADLLLGFSEAVLVRLMTFPTREQVLAFGDFCFSDDVIDNAQGMLISEKQAADLSAYSLPDRVLRRITGKPAQCSELFWAQGSAALLTPLKRLWYRMNILVWEWVKHGTR